MHAIAPLRFHGNEVMLFHILDPQEIRPLLKVTIDPRRSRDGSENRGDPRIHKDHLSRQSRRAYRAASYARPRRRNGLPAARDRSTSRFGAARVPFAAAGRELMGFLAPWFLAGLAALGVPVFVHLLRRHVTTPRPVSSLMFFERGTQSSTRHRRLKYLLLFALRVRARSARRSGVCQSLCAPRCKQTPMAVCCSSFSTIHSACAQALALPTQNNRRLAALSAKPSRRRPRRSWLSADRSKS